jgi:hypothetical protein
MRVTTALTVALLIPGSASAFCGAYAGAAGADIYNHASQIIVARSGDQTTLTLANDYEGALSQFALVIPVPHVLDPADVTTVDSAVFDTIDMYSAPRVVEYSCDEAYGVSHWGGSSTGCGLMLGCSSSGEAMQSDMTASMVLEGEADGVTVEAEFSASEYDIAILSATGGDGLQAWLDANGYAFPEGGEDLLQEYVDSGSYFLAARVNLAAVPDGRAYLSPLHISYTAEAFGLQLRLGTLSSGGEQDLVLHVVTDLHAGQVGVANYPELDVEDECMWRPEDDEQTFGTWFADRLNTEFDTADRAGWLVEYGWRQEVIPPQNSAHCDPCVVEPVTGTAVTLPMDQLGWNNGTDAHYTRIHMRYRPDQVDEDLVLYTSGISTNTQQRYVDYKRELEFLFPVCDEGFVAEPGQCGDSDDPEAPPPVRCTSVPLPPAGLALLMSGLVVFMRRRS